MNSLLAEHTSKIKLQLDKPEWDLPGRLKVEESKGVNLVEY